MLAIRGEDDVLLPARKSASLYRQYLKTAGNHDVTISIFANAGHDIRNFGPAYRTTLTGWLRDRFGA